MRLLFIFLTTLLIVSASAYSQSDTRYWVNGSGDWSDTNHWSVTSGGIAGASIPSIKNDVFFDKNSNSKKTLTISLEKTAVVHNISSDIKISLNTESKIYFKNISEQSISRFDNKSSLIKLKENTGKGPGDPFFIDAVGTKETCNGYCDGTITISLIAGIIDYPVTIILNANEADPACSPDQTIPGVMALPYTFINICGCGTDYSLIVIDNDGDVAGDDAAVTAKGPMNVFKTTVNETCAGDCDGSITINFILPFAGVPYSYNWSTGGITNSIINLCAGNYTVTITDKDGCTEIFSYPVTAPPAIVIDDSTYTPIICGGGLNGSIDVDASGGTGVLTYDIGFPPTNNDGIFTGLSSGTYTITITDGTCSITSGPYDLTDNPAIILTETHINVDCNGNFTGSIDLSVGGGTPTFTYEWEDDSNPGVIIGTNQDIGGLGTGSYTVTVTDSENCTETLSVIITEPNEIFFNGIHTDVTCFGGCDGTITLNPSGGTLPYSYTWSPAVSIGPIANGLCAGIYGITITDGNGCIKDTSIIITELNEIFFNGIHTDVLCFGDCNGTITLNPSGGNPPYSYIWSPAVSVGPIANGLCAGTYGITITDGNLCTKDTSIIITEPTEIFFNGIHTDVLCFGDCDGSITLNPTGGNPPYSYIWSPAVSVGPIANGLCAGTYDITITDGNGCTKDTSIIVTQPDEIFFNGIHTDVTCFGDCDGSITLNPSGGIPPYSYTWSPAVSIGPIANGLCAGTYGITITDGNGCTKDTSIIVTQPNEIFFNGIHTDVTCFGDCDGTITLNPSGGIPPYSYTWSPVVSIGPIANGLCAGTYGITITDGNGCTKDTSIIVTEPNEIFFNGIHTDVTCFGDCDGTITLNPSGGTLPYSYTWSPAVSVGPIANGLCAGTYDITIIDGNGCTKDTSIIVTQPDEISIDTVIYLHPSCYGNIDGSINITVIGGTPLTGGPPDYLYNWTTVGGTGLVPGAEDQTGLSLGWYYVTATDQNGCWDSLSVQLVDPYPIVLTETHIDPLCNGGSDGSIDLSVADGNPPYTYDWDNDGSEDPDDDTEDLVAIPAGTYCVTVTDAQNCTEILCGIIINEPTAIVIALDTLTPPLCYADSNGTATISVSGGTPVYVVTWCNGETGLIANSLYDGICIVTVQDANGCIETLNVDVIEPPALTIDSEAYTDVNPCNGDNNGTVTITASGGTGSLTYDIGTVPQIDDGLFTGLAPGPYTVTVTDANGCSVMGTLQTVSEPAPLSTLMDSTQVFCGGTCTGTATVTPSGGQIPYSYLWSNPSGDTQPTADSLCAGVYTVTVTDFLGCTITDNVIIIDTSSLSLTIQSIVPPTCYNDCNGSALAVPSGGYPPYTYIWSNSDTVDLADTLCDGTYTVTIYDSQMCSRSEIVIITEPDSIEISFTNIQDIACNGDCNGGFTASVTGGTPAFTYDLPGIPNGTDSVFTGLCSGNYTITVTDAFGCTNTYDTTFIDPPLLTGNITQDATNLCYGNCDAIVTLHEVGGTGPYSYNWSDLQITQSAIDLCVGWITGTITDDYGCTYIDSIEITQPDSIALSFVNTDIACGGDTSGQSVVSATGGTPFISFQWDSNTGDQVGNTAINLGGGIYFVTATDANGCTNSDLTQIVDTSDLQLFVVDSTLIDCYANCNGSYEVLASGGYPPYNYEWSNTDIGVIGDLLCAGIFYSVTVTDDSLCSRSLIFNLTQPDSIEITFTNILDITCNGDCNGGYTASVIGGTPTFTYDLPGIPNGPDSVFTGLCSGNYTITVTDNNNCTNSDSYSLIEPPLLDGSITDTTHVLCYGDTNGIAIVTPFGGVPPYSYEWSDLQLDSTAINLGAGTYYVTTTDFNGCTRVDSVTITQPDPLQLLFSLTEVPCGGGCTGTATAIMIGGTPGYFFQWDTAAASQVTQTAINLCAGFYSLTVTDANSCSVSGLTEIQDTSDLLISIDIINNISCFGFTDGSAQVSASGGYPFPVPPPYVYYWSTGDTIVDFISGLGVGLYFVTVYDDSLCSDADTFSITDADILNANFNTNNISCFGLCDGDATVVPSGGTPPIVSVYWETTETDTTIYNLCQGYWTVTITDNNGCIVVDSTEVIEPPQINISFNIDTAISCYNSCDGVISVVPSGGTAPYTYEWTGGLTDSTITGLCSGNIDITVTDVNGCQATGNILLTQPDSIQLAFINFIPVACGGDSTGSVEASVSTGGTGPFTYQWSNGDNTAVADSMFAAIYFITVTDLNGCTNIDNFEITDTSQIVLSVSDSSMIQCYGDCNGSYTVWANGGTPPYTYLWTTGDTDSTYSAMCADSVYIVTVLDNAGCSRSLMFNLTEPDSLYANFTDSIAITCFNDSTGSLTISPVGGTPGYSYEWDVPGQIDSVAINLYAGFHSVTVTDANGCTFVNDYGNMNAPPALLDSIETINSLCSNNTYDGALNLYPYGGTPPYTFLWSNDSTSQNLIGIEAGVYYITITDFLNCALIDSSEITPGIVVDAEAEADTVICSGDTITIYGYGQAPGQFAFWTTDISQPDTIMLDSMTISPTSQVTYYYFVWDSICYDVDSVVILTHPTVGIEAGDSITIFHDQSIQLYAIGGGDTVTYLWVPETGLDNPDVANPIASPDQTTIYYVYITTPTGCVEFDSVKVTVIPRVIIPTGFTPNGDGINDTWVIDNLSFFSDVLVEVYNRWGEKLFMYAGSGAGYEYDVSKQWDGTYNGKQVPVGTYYFVIDLHNENNVKPITGPLTIMR
ncbi:MAG: gliding motility-associated C-terminal domain-containing protein [Bacteroidota bacterium]